MALLCLLVYLLGGAQILPGLLALAARLEGSHEVILGCPDSEFELVLHHPTHPVGTSLRPAAPCEQRHGLASRVICLLASQDDSDPDHVLHLANGSVCEDPWHRLHLLPPPASCSDSMAGAAPLWATVTISISRSAASPASRQETDLHSSPCGHLLALAVTVLVI